MKVDAERKNPALFCIMEDPATVVFLDANFFIPADRSNLKIKGIKFDWCKEKWLSPHTIRHPADHRTMKTLIRYSVALLGFHCIPARFHLTTPQTLETTPYCGSGFYTRNHILQMK